MDLSTLNEQQRKAVETTEGRIRIVAGAGSGKTRVLACRYGYLVDELGILPSHILCITFTNKAAQEMKNRIQKMCKLQAIPEWVCTIHSFCVKFLRREIYRIGFPQNFSILDEEDQKLFAKQILEELKISKEKMKVSDVLEIIRLQKMGTNYIKDLMIESKYPNSKKLKEQIFEKFIAKQMESYAFDFDDLINITFYILQTFEEVTNKWQQEFEYIMIDEAQDLSKRQWQLADILSNYHHNLFVVGDPDQAIYGWRGGAVGLFLNFPSDETIILNENYRSTPNVLNVANSIIKNNHDRIEKDLFTHRDAGDTIIHYHGKEERDEGAWIANQIVKLKSQGAKYDDFAILYRTSASSRFIEQSLMQNNIPYTIWGGIRFYDRKEIKDALSYLRLVDSSDDLAFLRVINSPSRKLGKVFIEKVQTYAKTNKLRLFDALTKMIANGYIDKYSAKEFVDLIAKAKKKKDTCSIAKLLDYLLINSGLKKELEDSPERDKVENLEELLTSIKIYIMENQDEESITLTTYLQDIALYTNLDADKKSDRVKLMTIHQSKGLEFPYVFIISLSENIFPNARSITQKGGKALEEERRLMYVACTRAEDKLFLTESEGFVYNNVQKYPSRFIREIQQDYFITEGTWDEKLWAGTDTIIASQEYVEDDFEFILQPGDKVIHKKFGEGIVLGIDEDANTAKVQFQSSIRTIKADKLELIN